MKGREIRREQKSKFFKKALKIIRGSWIGDNCTPSQIESFAHCIEKNRKKCDCQKCKNPRRSNFYKGDGKLTMQERVNSEKEKMEMLPETWIRIEDCIPNGVYAVDARNFEIAVYNAEEKSFVGVRHKFGSIFLDSEEHWDLGAPHGTAKPLRFIQMLPENLSPDITHHKLDTRTGEEVRFVQTGKLDGFYVNPKGETVDFRYITHIGNKELLIFLQNFNPQS